MMNLVDFFPLCWTRTRKCLSILRYIPMYGELRKMSWANWSTYMLSNRRNHKISSTNRNASPHVIQVRCLFYQKLRIVFFKNVFDLEKICLTFFWRFPDTRKWRKSLEIGNRLDILDTVNLWYTGSVLAATEDKIQVHYDGQ